MAIITTELTGLSFIAGEQGSKDGRQFSGINPATGEELNPPFMSASLEDVEAAMLASSNAFDVYSKTSAAVRAGLLRAIAAGLDGASDELVNRAHLETALPLARLKGEVLRTSNQLRLFAGLVEEGSWVSAHIDTPLPERKPLPRPDIRSMLFPIGPVLVFGASNFPLAFSVAGGDTAAALAAGNTLVVKAHPAHPGTSEMVARIIRDCVAASALPAGVFSLLFDAGIEIAKALVQHPSLKAVTFTGSRRAGRSLMDLAAQRPVPVPCFTEMSSSNPVFIFPGAFDRGADSVASALFQSFTLGAGQFCTKPGMVFLPALAESSPFVAALEKLTTECGAFTMLTPQIAAAYQDGLHERTGSSGLKSVRGAEKNAVSETQTALLQADIGALLNQPLLSEEIFGPSTLIVHYDKREAMLEAARRLDGHLTATILGSEEDLAANQDLIDILEQKVGRLIFNGFPTGVEVSTAMVHGGPYPATSDSRFTSVGTQSIRRFVRPRCYQNYPDAVLPRELQDANPLGIVRLIDGVSSREGIGGHR